MYNTKIAQIFDEIADMLELEGDARKFEMLAYRKAAITVGTLQEDVADIYKKEGKKGLMGLSGVGNTIADRMIEYIETGKMSKYQEMKKKYPVDLANLTKIQGMGPKKAFKLYKALGIKDIDGLRGAIEKHKIQGLEGFGKRSEEEMARGIGLLESSKGRMLLGTALPEAEAITGKLLKSGLVEKAIICGSTRRMKETVGDLDILIISSRGSKVMDFVTSLPEVDSTIAKGPTKTTVMLKIGISCDFRLIEKDGFGGAVQYFTGNKDHNVKLREIAIKKGYKLNEYGLFNKKNANVAKGLSEDKIYGALGLDCMEPEMRENRGEIDLAQRHNLPRLVQLGDIKGDLQIHSKHSDGADGILEIAEEAIRLGRDYIGITDHTQSEYVAGGMTDTEFGKYFDEIDSLNDKLRGRIRILKSGEVDIKKDGNFDLKDKTLDRMDYVLAAIHSNQNMKKDEMTARVVKAMKSGYMSILAHPTARLINEREPIALDLDKVFEAAKENNVVMEIDALPMRLDLNDENIFRARPYGLKFAIDTDAHRLSHLQLMRYGIGMAKRGWLTKEDVVNTLTLKDLLKLFKK